MPFREKDLRETTIDYAGSMADRTTGRCVFLGTLVHSKSQDELEYLHNTAVCVDEKGIIVAIEPDCDQSRVEDSLYPRLGWSRGDVTIRTAREGEFFFPGFIGWYCYISCSYIR